ncbi:MAG TPA: cupredoxin domain-containing protein [Anaerolineales bacterium]|nr:cupredoxin domain-containing protein [Anaerolineales bacterium]
MSGKLYAVVALAILLVGCTNISPQVTTRITVDASDFAYQPASITVPVGEPVTITLNNIGNIEHDFVVEEISVTDVEASDVGTAAHHQGGHEAEVDYDLHFFAKAGHTASLQFTALDPGTYEVFCSVEGHKEAGMIATLVVTDQE